MRHVPSAYRGCRCSAHGRASGANRAQPPRGQRQEIQAPGPRSRRGARAPPIALPPAAPRLNKDPLSVIVVPAPLGVSEVSSVVMATPSTPIISATPVMQMMAPGVPVRPGERQADQDGGCEKAIDDQSPCGHAGQGTADRQAAEAVPGSNDHVNQPNLPSAKTQGLTESPRYVTTPNQHTAPQTVAP